MEIRKNKNEKGYWYETENTITEWNEFNVNRHGIFYNDEILFAWEELDNIKKDLFNGEE